jgi:transcriptional regulator with XRE-family HTH domain
VTVISDLPAAAQHEGLFRPPGTTVPGRSWPPTRQFICNILMASAAATATLTLVTPDDAAAMQAAVAESQTLPALPPMPVEERLVAIPDLLQRLRQASGLSWGDLAKAVGVSRRTIHNWLSGARIAGLHLTRLVEFQRVVDAVAAGSADDTRTRLMQPGPHGRSILDDIALTSRPARRRPLSTVSMGDLVAPVDESANLSPQQLQRRSSVRGGPLPGRRLSES